MSPFGEIHSDATKLQQGRSMLLEADLGFLYYSVVFGFPTEWKCSQELRGPVQNLFPIWPCSGRTGQVLAMQEMQEEHMVEGRKSLQSCGSCWQL